MKSFALALLVPLASAAVIIPPTTATGPDPAQITINSVSYSGSGCPQNSASTTFNTNKTLVTFGFDAFQTYIGPAISPTLNSKNCQLHLSIQYPGGFQYAVVASTYHGRAKLDAGVNGTFDNYYYFSEDPSATTETQSTIVGGGAFTNGQVYTSTDQVATGSIIYSPCGKEGTLNVDHTISLNTNNASASGSITNNDATVALTNQLHLVWQNCTTTTTV